jgi:hypothetical protein
MTQSGPGRLLFMAKILPGKSCRHRRSFTERSREVLLIAHKSAESGPARQFVAAWQRRCLERWALLRGGLDEVAESLFHEGSSAKPPASTHAEQFGRLTWCSRASVRAGFAAAGALLTRCARTGGRDRRQVARGARVDTRGGVTASTPPKRAGEGSPAFLSLAFRDQEHGQEQD